MNRLLQILQERRGALLADDMGLGKTPQALTVAARLGARRVLVAAPASVLGVWAAEARRWTPGLVPVVLDRDTPIPDEGIVIASYDRAVRRAAALREKRWDVLVLDEAHRLGDPTTQRVRAIRGEWDRAARRWAGGLRECADRVIALTGTPWSVGAHQLAPLLQTIGAIGPGGIAPSLATYRERYCLSRSGWGGRTEWYGCRDPEGLGRALAPICVRRTRAQVLGELPPLTRQLLDLDVELTPEARSALAELADVLGVVDPERWLAEVEHPRASAIVARARAALAPLLAARAIEEIDDLLSQGEPIVVAAHHHEAIEILRARYGERAIVIDGQTPVDERPALVERFQRGDVALAILSVRAASEGITLTRARHLIVVEADWSGSVCLQLEARIHRLGQRSACQVTYLAPRGTIAAQVISAALARAADLQAALEAATTPAPEPSAPPEPQQAAPQQAAPQQAAPTPSAPARRAPTSATWAKLRSGAWGLRVEGHAEPGDVVAVTRRDGTRSRERVGRVVWRGDGVTLAEVG